MMINRSVAILGAGFIGGNLVARCIEEGCRVRVLSRGQSTVSGVKWIQSVLSDRRAVAEAIQGVDIVYHLISSTVPGDQVNISQELFCNLSEMIQLLDLCVEYKVKRIVFVSSSSVYGPQKIPVDEDAIPNPISAHGIQKLSLEYYLKLYEHEHGLECKIMRLSNPYGPGQDLNGRQGFISIVLGNILADQPTLIRGDGEIVRDFIYIDDVVDACLVLGENETEHTVFNIGSGIGHSLNEVVDALRSIGSLSVPVVYRESRRVDIPRSVLSIERARNELNFSPQVSLEQGLSRYLGLYRLL